MKYRTFGIKLTLEHGIKRWMTNPGYPVAHTHDQNLAIAFETVKGAEKYMAYVMKTTPDITYKIKEMKKRRS